MLTYVIVFGAVEDWILGEYDGGRGEATGLELYVD